MMKRFALHAVILLVCGLVSSIAHAQQQASDDVDQIRQQIATLARGGKLDEAKTMLEESLQTHPENHDLQSMRIILAALYRGQENAVAAKEQTDHYLEFAIPRVLRGDVSVEDFSRSVNTIASTRQGQEGAEGPIGVVDEILKSIESQSAEDQIIKTRVVAAVSGVKAQQQIAQGRQAEAETLVTEQLQKLEALQQEHPENVHLIETTAQLMQVSVRATQDRAESARRTQKLVEYLEKHIEQLGDETPLWTVYITFQIQRATGLARQNPDEAEAIVTRLEEQTANSELAKERLAAALPNLERTISAARKLTELIGKDMIGLDVETWINSDPLGDEELKGKVVLLDFWAVWCGPCIATFPKLRAWHEEFSDRGFVIVGLTRYYNYQWDDEQQKAVRGEEVSAEDEQNMLVQFAAQHDLPWPLAITPAGSKMQEDYGVTGIPHVVLVDRQGKIQLIKIGAGTQTAQEIEAKIRELMEQ